METLTNIETPTLDEYTFANKSLGELVASHAFYLTDEVNNPNETSPGLNLNKTDSRQTEAA